MREWQRDSVPASQQDAYGQAHRFASGTGASPSHTEPVGLLTCPLPRAAALPPAAGSPYSPSPMELRQGMVGMREVKG